LSTATWNESVAVVVVVVVVVVIVVVVAAVNHCLAFKVALYVS